MAKILDQQELYKYTVLFLDRDIIPDIKKYVVIDSQEYKPIIPYDLPDSIAILAKGDFIGKEISGM